MDYKTLWEDLYEAIGNDLETAMEDEEFCADLSPAEIFQNILDDMNQMVSTMLCSGSCFKMATAFSTRFMMVSYSVSIGLSFLW